MSWAREQELLNRLESMVAAIERDTRAAERADVERDEQRAEAARSGALGPDWRAVQRRIDDGQTTLADVFAGGDDSPAAVRLRQQSRASLEAMATAEPPRELLETLAAAEAQIARLEQNP